MADRLVRQRGIPGASTVVQFRQRNEQSGGYEAVAFTGDETLVAQVYAGVDSPTLLTLPAQWDDASKGRVQVDFPALDLDPGIYKVFVLVDDVVGSIFEVEIEDSPGESEFRPTYITFREITSEIWQIEKTLSKVPADGSGFAVYRAQARDWLDLHILKCYRPGQSTSPYQFSIPWYDYSGVGPKWLSDKLSENALLLNTPNGRRLRLAMVYYCLGKILVRSAMQGQVEKQKDLAAYYNREADNLLITSVAEIDTNADGVAELTVNLGVTNTRRY